MLHTTTTYCVSTLVQPAKAAYPSTACPAYPSTACPAYPAYPSTACPAYPAYPSTACKGSTRLLPTVSTLVQPAKVHYLPCLLFTVSYYLLCLLPTVSYYLLCLPWYSLQRHTTYCVYYLLCLLPTGSTYCVYPSTACKGTPSTVSYHLLCLLPTVSYYLLCLLPTVSTTYCVYLLCLP